jgi:hypothetical protein
MLMVLSIHVALGRVPCPQTSLYMSPCCNVYRPLLIDSPRQVPCWFINHCGSKHIQTWVNDYLRVATTCLQRTLLMKSRSPYLLYTATSEQRPPVNNGHNFWYPRVVVVLRFDCTSYKEKEKNIMQKRIKFGILGSISPTFYTQVLGT